MVYGYFGQLGRAPKASNIQVDCSLSLWVCCLAVMFIVHTQKESTNKIKVRGKSKQWSGCRGGGAQNKRKKDSINQMKFSGIYLTYYLCKIEVRSKCFNNIYL